LQTNCFTDYRPLDEPLQLLHVLLYFRGEVSLMWLTWSFEKELISVCYQLTSHCTKIVLGILMGKNKM